MVLKHCKAMLLMKVYVFLGLSWAQVMRRWKAQSAPWPEQVEKEEVVPERKNTTGINLNYKPTVPVLLSFLFISFLCFCLRLMPRLSVSQGTSISLYLLRVINQGGYDHFVGGLTNKTLRLVYVTIQSMESICMTHRDFEQRQSSSIMAGSDT